MKTKSILLTAITTFIITSGWEQNQITMTAKKIKIREGNVEINYYQQGKGEVTLLFLHGWCIDGTYWKNQITHFSKVYTVYAMDLAGFGKSYANRVNWTIEEYAKDVSAFIDTLDFKNVILIGHSMSGEIILQTALSNNSKIIGIVGVDNFKFIDVEFTAEQMEQMTSFFPLLKHDFKKNAPLYAENMLFHPTTTSDIKELVKNDFATTDPKIGYSTFMNLMHFSQGVTSKLEELPYKLHLINSNTIQTNESGLEKYCKNGFFIKFINKTGHYPMIEKPLEFNKLLGEILERFN